jgi:SnoaL-like domain
MASNEAPLHKIGALQERLALMEDRDTIQRLQNIYGFYIDNRIHAEIAELFVETGASLEIGRRGN